MANENLNLAKVQVIEELIGKLEPVGETYTDEEVLENLNLAEKVLDNIFEHLCWNVQDTSCEASVQKVHQKSVSILKRLCGYASDYLTEVDE